MQSTIGRETSFLAPSEEKVSVHVPFTKPLRSSWPFCHACLPSRPFWCLEWFFWVCKTPKFLLPRRKPHAPRSASGSSTASREGRRKASKAGLRFWCLFLLIVGGCMFACRSCQFLSEGFSFLPHLCIHPPWVPPV